MKRKPCAIDLFAGAGGLSLGLESAGFEVVAASEIHPDPIMTYKCNHPGTVMIPGDVRNISGKAILGAVGDSRWVKKKDRIDLLAGGPPCQGFSTAGLKCVDDPRNSLIAKFISLIEEISPRHFLMENVPGLVTMYEGSHFKMLKEMLEQTGYEFRWAILHASDFGVPQMRRRVFVLGSRESAPPGFPKPTHVLSGNNLMRFVNEGAEPCPNVLDAIGDLPPLAPGEKKEAYEAEPFTPFQKEMREGSKSLHNHEATRHRKETIRVLSMFKEGGTQRGLPLDRVSGKPLLVKNIQRWDRHSISRAITSEPTDFIHYEQDRIPTIRELARLQTFPDRYVFLGQRTAGNENRRYNYCAQSQQVGNSVPPRLARAVGKVIIDAL
jgi:DNA (cytosine-5)-methyltransferase 1